ncbi:DNA-binding HxlR family transcriptional regulator [Methanomicrobium sp. W14]|uniref:hypothetical protein n=1 Tax=Methanomicrobium sp. W14 TaxID=2817839 RepID=UPI001AE88BE4|nr:hypothetical protein [Methanomicrobium sp. W14]MBP2132816.1 DNA-binding HxlR family transcriptional regulator [Methanomicrobium sp. W14]
MKDEAIEEYLSEIPLEIRNSLKPLAKDKAFAIYIAILKNEELKFNEIKKCFGTSSSGEIDRYLKELSRAGLVRRISKNMDDIGISEKSYYQSTNIGKKLIRGILEELLVKPNIERTKKEISIQFNPVLGSEYRFTKQELDKTMQYDPNIAGCSP